MTSDTAATSRPRKRDPERRRREILDAAAEIVVEQGTAALTHRAAAARAGVALGSTTRYFPSIDDLREATLRMLGDEIDASLFEDDDGAVYFLWHSGKIARMKPGAAVESPKPA